MSSLSGKNRELQTKQVTLSDSKIINNKFLINKLEVACENHIIDA